MDHRDTPSVLGCSYSSSTERASRAPTTKTDRSYRSNMSTCGRCYNHGIFDQIKEQDHFCSFRACTCDKCTRYSEYRSALPTENDAKETRARRKRHLAQEKKSSGPAPAHAQSQVKKASTGAGGTSDVVPDFKPVSSAPAGKVPAGKSPRGSADHSLPKVRASAPAGKVPERKSPRSSADHSLPKVRASAPAGKVPERKSPRGSADHSVPKVRASAPAVKVPAGKSPRGSPDHSLPKVRASAPEARRFEDATKRASFREVPRAYGPALRDLRASDPDCDDAEWERKLMAAEALLTLKNSSRPPVATRTQPCIKRAKAQCPDVKPQRK